MTYKEAIDIIRRDLHEVVPKSAITAHRHNMAVMMAIEALKKADKYRWHDLRKNPNDLPPNGYYDTSAYWHERYQNIRAFYDASSKKWYFHPDNNTGMPWVNDLSIIAWREIEQYKVKE